MARKSRRNGKKANDESRKDSEEVVDKEKGESSNLNTESGQVMTGTESKQDSGDSNVEKKEEVKELSDNSLMESTTADPAKMADDSDCGTAEKFPLDAAKEDEMDVDLTEREEGDPEGEDDEGLGLPVQDLDIRDEAPTKEATKSPPRLRTGYKIPKKVEPPKDEKEDKEMDSPPEDEASWRNRYDIPGPVEVHDGDTRWIWTEALPECLLLYA